MKTGKELGLEGMTVAAKGMPHQTGSIYFNINNILYYYSKCYISPMMAERLYTALCSLGVELNEAPDTANKGTILARLRLVCTNLRNYKKTYTWVESDAEQISKTMSYQLSMYLKHKREGGLDVVKALVRNKEVWDEMYLQCPFKQGIYTKKFLEMQEELIALLTEPYQLNLLK